MVKIETYIHATTFLLIQIKCIQATMELYSSISHMYILVDSIYGLTNDIKNYLEKTNQNNPMTDQILAEFQDLNRIAKKDPKRFIGNPINCFLILKKLTIDLDRLASYTDQKYELKKYIRSLSSKYVYPTNEDLHGCIVGLVRVEDAYNISPTQFMLGNLSKNYPSPGLSALDCFIIGSVAYKNDDFYHARNWLKAGYDNTQIPEEKEYFVELLINSTIKENDFEEAKKLLEEYLKLFPDKATPKIQLKQVKKELKKLKSSKESKIEFKRVNKYNFKERAHYASLCRGENLKVSKDSSLKCRYIYDNPILLISPIKEEIVNWDPYIVVYYDLMSSRQVSKVKQLSFPQLHRALVNKASNPEDYERSNNRISKFVWFGKNKEIILDRLEVLVGILTNTNISIVEPWQVLNYGISGQFEPHNDTLLHIPKSDETVGNRLATWMIYLEEPEFGGATVFTKLNLKVYPVFRSAVFWYNLHRNQSLDTRLEHAGCPVLLGSKWVANKWIRAKGQPYTTTCGLKDKED